jgi:hypothetical protein
MSLTLPPALLNTNDGADLHSDDDCGEHAEHVTTKLTDDDEVAAYIDLIILAIIKTMERQKDYIAHPNAALQLEIREHSQFITDAENHLNVHVQRIICNFKSLIQYDDCMATEMGIHGEDINIGTDSTHTINNEKELDNDIECNEIECKKTERTNELGNKIDREKELDNEIECNEIERKKIERKKIEHMTEIGNEIERTAEIGNEIECENEFDNDTERNEIECKIIERTNELGNGIVCEKELDNEIERTKEIGNEIVRTTEIDNEIERTNVIGNDIERKKELDNEIKCTNEIGNAIERKTELNNRTERTTGIAYEIDRENDLDKEIERMTELGNEIECMAHEHLNEFDIAHEHMTEFDIAHEHSNGDINIAYKQLHDTKNETTQFNGIDKASERQRAIKDAIARTQQRLNTLTNNTVLRANSHIDTMITVAIERLHQSQTDDEIANAILGIGHQLSQEFQRMLPIMPIVVERLQRTHHKNVGTERPTTALDENERPTTTLDEFERPIDGNERPIARIVHRALEFVQLYASKNDRCMYVG